MKRLPLTQDSGCPLPRQTILSTLIELRCAEKRISASRDNDWASDSNPVQTAAAAVDGVVVAAVAAVAAGIRI